MTGKRSRSSWLSLVAAAVCCLLPLAIPTQAQQSPNLARRIASAEAHGSMLPIDSVGDRHLTIDGDLSDWGDLAEHGGCIVQDLDILPEATLESGKHAALFKLLHDSQALYIAVRVADPSVIATNPSDPNYNGNGDSVTLALDLRPLSGSGPHLGDSDYTDGTYMLQIGAPGPGRSSVWFQSMLEGAGKAPLGPINIAGRLLPDGYSLELRIPFSSLSHVTAERLSEPIGFDIGVYDTDPIPGSIKFKQISYSWSGTDAAIASQLRFAKAGYQSPLHAPIVRVIPGRYLEQPGKRLILGGLITTRSVAQKDSQIEISVSNPTSPHPLLRKEGTKETSPSPYEGEGRGGVAPIAHSATIDFPELGIALHERILDLPSLNRDRYTITTHVPTLPAADMKTSFETLTWRQKPEVAALHPRRDLPDLPAGKASTLPNGWRVTPVGRALAFPGDMPLRMVFTPDSKYLLVNTAGYNTHSVSAIYLDKEQIVRSVEVYSIRNGMCLDAAGKTLYLSGGSVPAKPGQSGAGPIFANAVQRVAWSGGKFTRQTGMDLPAGSDKTAFVGGIAAGNDGALYVVNTQTDTILKLDAATGSVQATAHQGYRPFAIALSPAGSEVAVTNWGDQSVSLLDAATLHEIARVPVGSQPVDLIYNKDGRLFVANAGADSVSVVQNGRVTETIKTSLDPNAPIGSTPNALALSPDGARLYVANGGNNDVAMIDISNPAESRVMGFIPTGWYPSALAVAPDGKRLFIGTGKGLTFRSNPTGDYIGTLLQGHVSIVNVPDARQLAAYTRQVIANVPSPEREARRDPQGDPTLRQMAGKIKHVLYIIRENRTYDQVFGDVPEGNGDPGLTMFGREVTPNAHRLAKDYVLLDNLYCSGEVSEDGHQWCDAAYATDYTEKDWPNTYSGRTGIDADERLSSSPAGYLWDNCARHGLTYYSYGEFAYFVSSPKSPPVFVGSKALSDHASLAWTQISFDKHDTERFTIFANDLHKAEQTGDWPQFIVMSLGEDHTQGLSAGLYTPVAHVAANDQALGQIVEAVSHSRFWNETAIFVIEDDAQDGQDHVDAHRTAGLVISPYVRRGIVDSTFYTTASFVRTIELLLGLPPMTQFDSTATPLYRDFLPQPQMLAYSDLPALVNLEARNSSTGPGAIASARLDFSGYDRADPIALNHILWQALKPGRPEPAPVRSALVALASFRSSGKANSQSRR